MKHGIILFTSITCFFKKILKSEILCQKLFSSLFDIAVFHGTWFGLFVFILVIWKLDRSSLTFLFTNVFVVSSGLLIMKIVVYCREPALGMFIYLFLTQISFYIVI